jgi:hypothetical protein
MCTLNVLSPAWHVTGACSVTDIAKASVVWRGLNEVVDERTGIADERSRATGRH